MDTIPDVKDILFALLFGVGLSAACGLRVFVPVLIAGIGAKLGWIPVSGGWEWMSSWIALGTFGLAATVEIASYKIPFVDNLLDTVATPASVIAGTVLSASFLGTVDPITQWILALIVGGGAAGITQLGTVTARATSSTATAGFANPILATVESVGSIAVSFLSIFAPLLGGIVVAIILVSSIFFIRKKFKKVCVVGKKNDEVTVL